MATNVVLEDSSRSNGTIVTEVYQKVSGAMISTSLRGCTAPIANLKTSCTKVSDFTYLPAGYITAGNVTAEKWPHTTYFNRYLAPDASHVTRIWTPQINNQTNYNVDSASGRAVNIRLVDSSKGTGSALRVDQKTYGGGAGLRACTGTIQNLRTSCLKESDFVAMPGTYDRVNDVYQTGPGEVAWPFVTYFNRYLATDGSHVTRTWSPTGISYPNPPGWGP